MHHRAWMEEYLEAIVKERLDLSAFAALGVFNLGSFREKEWRDVVEKHVSDDSEVNSLIDITRSVFEVGPHSPGRSSSPQSSRCVLFFPGLRMRTTRSFVVASYTDDTGGCALDIREWNILLSHRTLKLTRTSRH